ncbi:MAG: CRISPR-associated endoribonuclease Cas6 [Nitrospirae bacterium]|nr:CRISPR-associated endoribonuclease Cas6 [Nitrospirota bacterium]
MRIRIVLYNGVANASIPINYNHLLAATIYAILREYSHDCSPLQTDKTRQEAIKRFKMFTFSHLRFDAYRIDQERVCFDKGYVQWYVSSPVKDFLFQFVERIAERQTLVLDGVSLEIDRVEALKEVCFSDEMSFTVISPITVTSNNARKNTLPRYLRYTDSGFAEAVRGNLIKKYIMIHKAIPKDDSLSFVFDKEYVDKRAGKIQKKISFLSMEVIGFVAPFKVKGSPELIRIGYDAGFGEKGNMGFGMVKEITKT